MNRKLESFIELLQGEFNNAEQFKQEQEKGNLNFPFAKHKNTICNSKIEGLPLDYKGIFMLEESYYQIKDKTNAQPHLFCFMEEEDKIKLISYEMPKEYTKETFQYQNLTKMKFDELKISEKFTPAMYTFEDGVWQGGSVSMFTPVLKFSLFEKFSKEQLEVSETMEVNGKKTFGYDVPIIYKRIQ